MDLINLFIQKFLPTNNFKEKTVKDLFQSDENKIIISQNLYRELFLPNNQELYDKIRKGVDKYVTLWITTGKLDKLSETNGYSINASDDQLRFYNKQFIDTFKDIITNYDTYNFEIQNNPYKHILSYKVDSKKITKKISELQVEDFNYATFNNYNDKFNNNLLFNANYHKIPYYEKSIYKRNYDILDMGSFRERKLVNDNYKLYNNYELFNNVDYLRKK